MVTISTVALWSKEAEGTIGFFNTAVFAKQVFCVVLTADNTLSTALELEFVLTFVTLRVAIKYTCYYFHF